MEPADNLEMIEEDNVEKQSLPIRQTLGKYPSIPPSGLKDKLNEKLVRQPMLKQVREVILEKLLSVDSRTIDSYTRALRR